MTKSFTLANTGEQTLYLGGSPSVGLQLVAGQQMTFNGFTPDRLEICADARTKGITFIRNDGNYPVEVGSAYSHVLLDPKSSYSVEQGTSVSVKAIVPVWALKDFQERAEAAEKALLDSSMEASAQRIAMDLKDRDLAALREQNRVILTERKSLVERLQKHADDLEELLHAEVASAEAAKKEVAQLRKDWTASVEAGKKASKLQEEWRLRYSAAQEAHRTENDKLRNRIRDLETCVQLGQKLDELNQDKLAEMEAKAKAWRAEAERAKEFRAALSALTGDTAWQHKIVVNPNPPGSH